MDDTDLIATYARQLEAALRRAGRPLQPLVDESVAHLLEDAARIAGVEGCGEAEAARRAIARFGDVAAVVAASRRHGRTLAASVARIASVVLLAVVAWELTTGFFDPWPADTGDVAVALAFYGELAIASIALLRPLHGHTAGWLLRAVVQLNGAVGLALLVGAIVAGRLASRAPMSTVLFSVEPILVLMVVQAAAGLRALGGRRHADGTVVAG